MGGYYIQILHGAGITVLISLLSLGCAIVLGLLAAAAKLSHSRLLVWPATIYTTLIRGIPELVLLLLLYYGAPVVINLLLARLGNQEGIDLNPFLAGVLTIGFIYGAYMAENFRGAIKAIPFGQREAGLAFGMHRWLVFWRITWPQMIRYVLPSFTNSWMALIKATALVSLIGLRDMTYLARQAGDATHRPFIFILLAAMIYLLITTLSLWALRKLHMRYSIGSEKITL